MQFHETYEDEVGYQGMSPNGYEEEGGTQMLATSCLVCSRPLRDPESIERGVGPFCAAKHGMFAATGAPDVAALEQALETAPPLMASAVRARESDPRAAVSAAIHAAGRAWETHASDYAHYIGAAMEVAAALGYAGTARALQRVFIEGREYDEEGNPVGKARPKGVVVRAVQNGLWEIELPYLDSRNVWFETNNALKASGARNQKDQRGNWHTTFPAGDVQWIKILNALVPTMAGTLGVLPNGETFIVPNERQAVPQPATAQAPVGAGPEGAVQQEPGKLPKDAASLEAGDTVYLKGKPMVVAWVSPDRVRTILLTPEQADESRRKENGYLHGKKYGGITAGMRDVSVTPPTEAEVAQVAETTDKPARPAAVQRDMPERLMPHQREGVLWLCQQGSGLLAYDMGLGKCLLPGARVYAAQGPIPIEHCWELPSERTLSDGTGEWRVLCEPLLVNSFDQQIRLAAATQVYRQRIDAPVRVIGLDDGSVLRATQPHRFLTPAGWKAANDLAEGDRVAVAARTVQAEGSGVSPELAELFAWQLGEGCESTSSGWRFTNTDPMVLERVALLAKGLGVTLPPARPEKRRPNVCTISSGKLRPLLEPLGFPTGTRSAQRLIPPAIHGASRSAQVAFLRAFFEAEGSVTASNNVAEITSASESVIRSLAAMLRGFGIWLRVSSKRARATNGSGIYRTYWRGIVSGNALAAFAEHIGFLSLRKNAVLAEVVAARRNTNVEGVPSVEIVREANGRGVTYAVMGAGTAYGVSQGMSKPLARAVADNLSSRGHDDLAERLRSLANDAIHWAKVKSVETVEYAGYVYDLCVPGPENYVAEGVVCHNTACAIVAADYPALVVCPKSLKANWVKEVTMWRPDLTAVTVETGKKREEASLAAAEKADVTVVNYDILSRYVEKFRARGFKTLIVDESHYIKNFRIGPKKNDKTGEWRTVPSGSARALAVWEVAQSIRRRFCLTGTPMDNKSPCEMFGQLHLVAPNEFPKFKPFGARYCDPKEVWTGTKHVTAYEGASNILELHEKINGKTMLRKTKELLNLPEKLRCTKLISLDDVTAKQYEAAARDLFEFIRRRGGWEAMERAEKAEVLVRMTTLSHLTGVGKVEAFLEEVQQHWESTHRPLIIFANHRDVQEALISGLKALNYRVGSILGGSEDREETKVRFQTGVPESAPPEQRDYYDMLVLSIGAAREGLTLTRAQDMFFIERTWSPAHLAQAEDRIHRIGQKNQVTITYYDAPGTLDEEFGDMLMKKIATAQGVMSGVSMTQESAAAEIFGRIGSSGGMKPNQRGGGVESYPDWIEPT